jgi:hypothetical protein
MHFDVPPLPSLLDEKLNPRPKASANLDGHKAEMADGSVAEVPQK